MLNVNLRAHSDRRIYFASHDGCRSQTHRGRRWFFFGDAWCDIVRMVIKQHEIPALRNKNSIGISECTALNLSLHECQLENSIENVVVPMIIWILIRSSLMISMDFPQFTVTFEKQPRTITIFILICSMEIFIRQCLGNSNWWWYGANQGPLIIPGRS